MFIYERFKTYALFRAYLLAIWVHLTTASTIDWGEEEGK